MPLKFILGDGCEPYSGTGIGKHLKWWTFVFGQKDWENRKGQY